MFQNGFMSMKKVFLYLNLSMAALLSGQTGVAAETGLHDVAKEILQQCSCRYEHEQFVQDKMIGRTILIASVLCDCGAMDISMAVACRAGDHHRPGPKECALDNTISLSKLEKDWPKDWPSENFDKMKINQESAGDMGTTR